MPADEVPDSRRPDRAQGLDVARQALAAARAAARTRERNREGDRGVPGAGRDSARRTRWRPGSGDIRSGARPDDRDPQPLGRAIHRLTADRGWELDVAVGGVLGRWAEIVGPEVAAHCSAEGIADGVLTVSTDSTAWATQLRLLAPTVLRRINAEVGPGTLRRVDVRGPSGPRWRRGRLSVRGRGPRDTYG